MLGDRPFTFDRVFRMAVYAGVVYALVLVTAHLSDVLLPFAVAFLGAYLLNPLVTRIQKTVKSRAAAVFLALAGVALAGFLLAGLLAPMVVSELRHMGQIAARVISDADLARRAAQIVPPDLWETLRATAQTEQVKELLLQRDVWSLAGAISRRVVPGIWGIVAGTTNVLGAALGVFVVGLYLVFLLLDFQRSKAEWEALVPPGWRKPAREFLKDFDDSMNRYFRAQAIIAVGVGATAAAGFTLIGLPLGIVLGLLVGLLSMVPYLQVVAGIPALLLALVTALESGTSVWLALGFVGLVFLAVQFVQDVILAPRIMGEATGLSPAMMLLSISVWGKLLGFFGLIIAIPGTCLILAYYHRLLVDPD